LNSKLTSTRQKDKLLRLHAQNELEREKESVVDLPQGFTESYASAKMLNTFNFVTTIPNLKT